MASLLCSLAWSVERGGLPDRGPTPRGPQPLFRGASPLLLFGIQFFLVDSSACVLACWASGDERARIPADLHRRRVLVFSYVVVVWLFGVRSGALALARLDGPAHPPRAACLGDIGHWRRRGDLLIRPRRCSVQRHRWRCSWAAGRPTSFRAGPAADSCWSCLRRGILVPDRRGAVLPRLRTDRLAARSAGRARR